MPPAYDVGAGARLVWLKRLGGLMVVVAPLVASEAGLRPPAAITAAATAEPFRSQTPQRKPLRQPDIFFVPTLESVADQMLKLAGVTRTDVVYDLGSGDGRILMLAAQKYGARGVGIELDPRLVDLSRGVAREAKVDDRVSFIEGDLFEADITGATVVTIYLSTTVNARLEPKLRQELRPGARVVSHQFPVGRWTADRTERADDGTLLYLWTIPPR